MKFKTLSFNSSVPVGFTLLEILTVVIIIGVLTVLAVPRYFATVERMRAEEGKQMLLALLAAQKHYALENNGAYATTLNKLDVNFNLSSDYFISVNDADISPGGGQLAQVRRRSSSSGNYTLRIDDEGVITCTGTATLCATLVSVLNN